MKTTEAAQIKKGFFRRLIKSNARKMRLLFQLITENPLSEKLIWNSIAGDHISNQTGIKN